MADQRADLVRKMVAEGTSDDDIRATLKVYDAQQAKTATQATPPAPVSHSAMAEIGRAMRGQPAGELGSVIAAHPVTAGATVGGALASGGTSILGELALAALGAAGGAGYGLAAKDVQQGQGSALDNAETMAKEAGGAAAGQAAGPVLKMLGRGAYRVALAPTERILGKYPNVVSEGLSTATPVSIKGLAKATASKTEQMAAKAAALTDADQRVAFRASGIANDAAGPLSDFAIKQSRAGLPNPMPAFTDRLAQFQAMNPDGTLTPSSLEAIKGTLDDQAGGAFKKIRAREPLTTDDKGTVEMLGAMNRAQSDAIPEYRSMNRGIMDAEGLRKAIQRRTVGSGGNQVLDTLLTLLGGPKAIPGRVAMAPPVLSTAGIAMDRAASAAAPSLRTALIAALSGSQ